MKSEILVCRRCGSSKCIYCAAHPTGYIICTLCGYEGFGVKRNEI